MGITVMFLSVTLMVTFMSVCVAEPQDVGACKDYDLSSCKYVQTISGSTAPNVGWGEEFHIYECNKVKIKCSACYYKPKEVNTCHQEKVKDCDDRDKTGFVLEKTSNPCSRLILCGHYYQLWQNPKTKEKFTCGLKCCCKSVPKRGDGNGKVNWCSADLIKKSEKNGLCPPRNIPFI